MISVLRYPQDTYMLRAIGDKVYYYFIIRLSFYYCPLPFIIFSPWIEKKIWATFEDGIHHLSVHLKDYRADLFEQKTEKILKKEKLRKKEGRRKLHSPFSQCI